MTQLQSKQKSAARASSHGLQKTPTSKVGSIIKRIKAFEDKKNSEQLSSGKNVTGDQQIDLDFEKELGKGSPGAGRSKTMRIQVL